MFLENFKKGGSKGNESSAFNFLFENLLKRNLRGSDKAVTLSGMNMEDSAPCDFVPGMIYTFLYTSNLKDNLNGKSFIDAVPIILCLRHGSTIQGLNFNMMPNEVRASLLDMIVESDKDTYAGKKDGDFPINKNFTGLLMKDTGPADFIKFASEKTKANLSQCVRTYSPDFIVNPRLIEYDMWEYIPYMNFKDAVRGGNLAAIQASIIKKDNK